MLVKTRGVSTTGLFAFSQGLGLAIYLDLGVSVTSDSYFFCNGFGLVTIFGLDEAGFGTSDRVFTFRSLVILFDNFITGFGLYAIFFETRIFLGGTGSGGKCLDCLRAIPVCGVYP